MVAYLLEFTGYYANSTCFLHQFRECGGHRLYSTRALLHQRKFGGGKYHKISRYPCGNVGVESAANINIRNEDEVCSYVIFWCISEGCVERLKFCCNIIGCVIDMVYYERGGVVE